MGRKALLAVICWLTLSETSAKTVQTASGVIDNVSAESGPRLYRNVPVGVYASAIPYASYSFNVPTFVSPKSTQGIPVKDMVVQSTNGYLKDSYGQRFVETPQTVSYKTMFPQQFVELQSLPSHLSQPLVAASSAYQYGQTPHFFGQNHFGISNLQSFTPSHVSQFSSQPLIYASNVRNLAPTGSFNSQINGNPSAQQQSTANKNVYLSSFSADQLKKLTNEPRFQKNLGHPSASTSANDSKQSNAQVAQANKLQLVHVPKETKITTVTNGKKTVVNLITKPPIPLLDLTLLEPLTFKNPLVPQHQHFLPRINQAVYKTLPELNEVKKHQMEFVVQNTKTYDSESVKNKPKASKKKSKKKVPQQHKEDDEVEVNISHHTREISDEEPEISYEIQSPNYKETFTEHKMSYNKETQSEPVSISYEKQTNKEPVHYSYDERTEKKPIHYSYTHSSKEPAQKQTYYANNDEGPKQLVYHFKPENTNKEQHEQHQQAPPQNESEESSEDTSEELTEERHQPQQEHRKEYHESQRDAPKTPNHNEQVRSEHKEHVTPEHNKEFRPEYKEQVRPEYKEQVQPEHRESFRPEHKEEVRPEHREQVQPEHREHVRPEHREHVQSEHREQVRPELREHVRPEHREHVQSEHREHVRPEHREHVRPEHREHVRSEHREHIRPEYREQPRPEHKEQVRPENREQVYYHFTNDEGAGLLQDSPKHKKPVVHYVEKFIQPITPEYEEDITFLPTHKPHAEQNHNEQYDIHINHNVHPAQKKNQHQHRHYEHPQNYYSSEPVVQEKSKRIIVKEGTTAEVYKPNNQLMAEMVKKQEETDEDFEKAYKDAAFGFPAYDTPSIDVEKEIYNPEAYGASRYSNEYNVEKTPLRQYEAEGDEYPTLTRSQYKDIRDKETDNYYLDYAVSRPESLRERHKNKEDYFETYQIHKPEVYFGSEDKKKKQSEKYTAAPAYGYHGKPQQKQQSSQYKVAPQSQGYNYNKEAPRDNSAFASRPHQRFRSKTQFVEPQFQYGFEPLSIPHLLDSELAAMSSNNSPKAEKPGTRKKVYKENWYIKKSSRSGNSGS